jgi:hypothetical protein
MDVGPRFGDDLGRLRQDVAGDAEEIDRVLPEEKEADEEGDEQPAARDPRGELAEVEPARPSRTDVGLKRWRRAGDMVVGGDGSASPM